MSQIRHEATILEVDKQKILVNVENSSSCGGCQHRSTCTMVDCKNKVVEINILPNKKLNVGEKVYVTLDSKSCWFAVFFGYILPLILVLSVLVSTYYITRDEEKAGIYSLISLPPYYLMLFLMRKFFNRKFEFKIDE